MSARVLAIVQSNGCSVNFVNSFELLFLDVNPTLVLLAWTLFRMIWFLILSLLKRFTSSYFSLSSSAQDRCLVLPALG